jgi:hypothetical protein
VRRPVRSISTANMPKMVSHLSLKWLLMWWLNLIIY